MKKFIFTLLLTILMIPCVNADCVNLYEAPSGNLRYLPDSYNNIYLWSSLDGTSYYNFNLDSSKTYLFYATLDNKLVDSLILPGTGKIDINHSKRIITSSEKTSTVTIQNFSKFTFFIFNPEEDEIPIYQSWQFWLVEGTEVCIPSAEPDVPDEPVIADVTLDTFYSIYLEKMSNLATYSIENKYLLAFVTIIFLFGILELILFLFNRGGYRR